MADSFWPEGWDTTKIVQRSAELAKDSHVKAQVDKVMEVLRNVQGINHTPADEVLNHAGLCIAMLEADPEMQATANFGGVSVARGPSQGYSLHVHVSDVFVMRMDKYEPERFHPWTPGKLISKEK